MAREREKEREIDRDGLSDKYHSRVDYKGDDAVAAKLVRQQCPVQRAITTRDSHLAFPNKPTCHWSERHIHQNRMTNTGAAN